MEQEYNYKIIILGSVNVGKTSISNRFVYNGFKNAQDATVGASFFRKTINYDLRDITLQIWDTSGNNRFSSLLPMYYRNAKGVIVVYDVTERKTFNRITEILADLRKHVDYILPIVLVGNKFDLGSREVTYEEGAKIAKIYNLEFIECSAKTGVNIPEIFNLLVDKLTKDYVPVGIKLDEYKRESCCF